MIRLTHKRRQFVMFAVFNCLFMSAVAQDEPEKLPNVYLGFSTGIENKVGIIGPTIDVPVDPKLWLGAGAGLGSWGYKLSGYVQYHPHGIRKLFIEAGYTHSTGLPEIDVEMEISTGEKKEVKLRYNAVGNINFSVGYAWRIGRQSNRFYLDAGMMARIAPVEESYKLLTPGVELSSASKAVLKLLAPGGLRIGTGFTFGL